MDRGWNNHQDSTIEEAHTAHGLAVVDCCPPLTVTM
jgi:hypothetical protein